jgi:DNA-binding IclR family transcriptional regulator
LDDAGKDMYCLLGNSVLKYQAEGSMPRTGKPAVRHVAAVERALAVLDAVAEAEDVGTNELARRTGINASTVSRLLATLAARGYVRHSEETGRYQLGPRLVQLGSAALAGLDLRELARPVLVALAAETGETATLSVPGEPDAITIDFVQSSSSVQSVARIGRPSVAHATATGKVALAYGAAELADGSLRAYTERTITDRGALDTELARVREGGFAEALGEREDDLNAAAVPVLDARGEVVAILGLQGPASRFDAAAVRRATAVLLDSARRLSVSLGGAKE